MARKLAWFSNGAASAVMSKLVLDEFPDAIVVQCDLRGSEHPDNERFSWECEVWYGKHITYLQSERYRTIDDVFEGRKYHAGIAGAPCTSELKVAPRLDFQRPSDEHFWGYTADKTDAKRFARMLETYPEMKQRAPLVERGITKKDCLKILRDSGLEPPKVYSLGFPNANCIGCVKASSPKYWALIRQEFPEIFARRAEQSNPGASAQSWRG